MAEELVRLDRPFQTWVYTVGHCDLLLRSTKSDALKTRVDVLFKGVKAMMIHPRIESLVLERTSDDEASQFRDMLGVADATDVYVLSREPLLLVAAGYVFWHEDEGEYFDPCHFDVFPPPGLESVGTYSPH